MQWFYNMKIGTKLVASFILVAMFSAAIGYVSITRLNLLQQSGTEMYELNAVPLADLIDVSTYFQRQRKQNA